MAKPQLPQLSGPRVPQETIDKADQLTDAVHLLGHPRAQREDVVGALIDAATPQQAADALPPYYVRVSKALKALQKG